MVPPKLLNPGDRMIASGMLPNAVMRPLRHLEKAGDITVSIASCDRFPSRFLLVFVKLVAAAEGRVLFGGHAGVNRVILTQVLGMPLSHLFLLP